MCACLLLAGCTEGFPSLRLGNVVTQEVTLAGGFRVAAPSGYCIDQSQTRKSEAITFVAMAGCSNLGGRQNAGPIDTPALLTASIAYGPLPARRALGDYYQSENGRAALSARGQATDVIVHQAKTSARALYIDLTDRAGSGAGLAARRWAGFVDVAGYAAVLSVHSAAQTQLTPEAGEAVIRDLAQALVRANTQTPVEKMLISN